MTFWHGNNNSKKKLAYDTKIDFQSSPLKTKFTVCWKLELDSKNNIYIYIYGSDAIYVYIGVMHALAKPEMWGRG